MASNGKRLEGLVAHCERELVPAGFEVTSNQLVHDDEGNLVAELDVLVRGRVGTTDLAWLIECRDRPSQGAAPNSWIEQLVGRRNRLNLNKVTAVSTTGFAPGVAEYAAREGIELREVAALSPEAFATWFGVPHINALTRRTQLREVNIILAERPSPEAQAAVEEALAGLTGSSRILRSKPNGQIATPDEAFLHVTQDQDAIWNRLTPTSPPLRVGIQAEYPEGNRFELDTRLGPVEIACIIFKGEARLVETILQIARTEEYRSIETGEILSQVVTFEPHGIMGKKYATEMHHLAATGETHVIMRRVED